MHVPSRTKIFSIAASLSVIITLITLLSFSVFHAQTTSAHTINSYSGQWANALSAGPNQTNLHLATIEQVKGKFFKNPNNSGVFDVTPSTKPAFKRNFSMLNFNPPTNLQNCRKSTGVDENTRPFTDVIENTNGTCKLQTAASGSQKAGLNDLFAFESVFTANLHVPAKKQITINITGDDGWILSIGKDKKGHQPTYVSGPMNNPPASGKGPFTGYPVLGANNGPSAPSQYTVTIDVPAAGTYPIEVDYTECCGGALVLLVTPTA